jgi:carbamoyltransferase
VPVLINTSFNIKGEPIVETPDDAVACFLNTGIDYLALHDLLISKGPFHKVIAPLVRVYTDVVLAVKTGRAD